MSEPKLPDARSFDPEGDGYDYETAEKYGLKPNATGHWPSRADNGQLLKGRRHETFDLLLQGEAEQHYEIIRHPDDGRYYSFPETMPAHAPRIKSELMSAHEKTITSNGYPIYQSPLHVLSEFTKPDAFISQLERHEGYRERPYRDSKGYWTVGFGTLLTKERDMTQEQAAELTKRLYNPPQSGDPEELRDFWKRHAEFDAYKKRTKLTQALRAEGIQPNMIQQYVLTNMSYAMGVSGVLEFRKMLKALRKGDTNRAADELLKSKFAEDVGDRAIELASILRHSAA